MNPHAKLAVTAKAMRLASYLRRHGFTSMLAERATQGQILALARGARFRGCSPATWAKTLEFMKMREEEEEQREVSLQGIRR